MPHAMTGDGKEIYLKILNLGLQLAALIAGDRTCNDRPCDATCSAKCLFRRNKNIGNILPNSIDRNKQ